MTLLADAQVLVAGGNGPGGEVPGPTAEIYTPATGRRSSVGNLDASRAFFAATTLPDGRVLAAGGDIGRSERTPSAELFHPSTRRWSPTGDMAVARGGLGLPRATVVLPNGDILVVASARNDPSMAATAELYSSATGEWHRTSDLGETGLQSHTATALPDRRVLVAGGANRARIVLSKAWVWIPEQS